MDEVIVWATFAGAWPLVVARLLYQGSVEPSEMDFDREGIDGSRLSCTCRATLLATGETWRIVRH